MLRSMRSWLFLFAIACALYPSKSFASGIPADVAAIPIRGVIEGFYGKPWTQADRLDQLAFYGKHQLNTYIYAPKDDPYHREKWREAYPLASMANMEQLIKTAEQNQVDFVFAISPGIDVHLEGAEKEQDIEALLHKFDSLYAMGVRSFAVFFDDIKNKDGAGQARFLNEVNRRFIRVKPGVKPLFTVPTEYFTADMIENGKLKAYTKGFSENLDRDIIVMYTGPGVVCDGILPDDIEKVNAIYGRKMAVWWNYPVNDYLLPKLALGPITGLSGQTGQEMSAFIMNPMQFAALSKIALATGADYAKNPAAYDEEKSWQAALKEQYGENAAAMEVFADHSQRMEKHWAHAGRADAPLVRRHMDDFFAALKKGQDTTFAAALLNDDFASLYRGALTLEEKLQPNVYKECQPQLALAKKLAAADETALAMLNAKANGQKYLYQRYRKELLLQKAAIPLQTEVKLSEKTAAAFIEEALQE